MSEIETIMKYATAIKNIAFIARRALDLSYCACDGNPPFCRVCDYDLQIQQELDKCGVYDE